MQKQEIPAEVVNAILAANHPEVDPADPYAVRRLDVDGSGQLWTIRLAMTERSGTDGFDLGDFQDPAVGFTELAELETWHPIHHGFQPTVAEVLVQLPDRVRRLVAGVQFAGRVMDRFVPPVSTGEGDSLRIWRVERVRLYRRSGPIAHIQVTPFTVSDSAFDKFGRAHLLIDARRRPGGEWQVTVARQPRSDVLMVGRVTGALWTDVAVHAGAPDDVLEAARKWIVDNLPEGTTEMHFIRINSDAFSGDQRDGLAGALMTLQRTDPRA
jgi:hypothetical protein